MWEKQQPVSSLLLSCHVDAMKTRGKRVIGYKNHLSSFFTTLSGYKQGCEFPCSMILLVLPWGDVVRTEVSIYVWKRASRQEAICRITIQHKNSLTFLENGSLAEFGRADAVCLLTGGDDLYEALVAPFDGVSSLLLSVRVSLSSPVLVARCRLTILIIYNKTSTNREIKSQI